MDSPRRGFQNLPEDGARRRPAVERWATETPPEFLFAVKVSRYITHIKRLRETGKHLRLLPERVEPLLCARKLGPLLWQLLPTFKRDDYRLANALAAFPPRPSARDRVPAPELVLGFAPANAAALKSLLGLH